MQMKSVFRPETATVTDANWGKMRVRLISTVPPATYMANAVNFYILDEL